MAFSRTCWGSKAFFPAIRPSCVPPCEEYITCWNEKSRMWEVRFISSMGEMVVLATWIIRSKTSTLELGIIFHPCLQTLEGWCTIRIRHQPTDAQQQSSHSMEKLFVWVVFSSLSSG